MKLNLSCTTSIAVMLPRRLSGTFLKPFAPNNTKRTYLFFHQFPQFLKLL